MGTVRTTRRTSHAAIDNEHLVQVELADAVLDAVERDAPRDEIAGLLDHFIQFTELHFMSEGLLMRLHAYPDLDEHVADHAALVKRIHALRDAFNAQGSTLDAERAIRLKGEILSHIRNRDAALHVYIAQHRN